MQTRCTFSSLRAQTALALVVLSPVTFLYKVVEGDDLCTFDQDKAAQPIHPSDLILKTASLSCVVLSQHLLVAVIRISDLSKPVGDAAQLFKLVTGTAALLCTLQY